jgi:hypothetical protein
MAGRFQEFFANSLMSKKIKLKVLSRAIAKILSKLWKNPKNLSKKTKY